MQIPIQIAFVGLEPSDAMQQKIRDNVNKLEHFCSDIIACRVAIETEGKHKQKGRPYRVRIDLSVPNDEIIVNHTHMNPDSEDAYDAIRHSFDAAERQLKEYAARRRHDVKHHTALQSSSITQMR